MVLTGYGGREPVRGGWSHSLRGGLFDSDRLEWKPQCSPRLSQSSKGYGRPSPPLYSQAPSDQWKRPTKTGKHGITSLIQCSWSLWSFSAGMSQFYSVSKCCDSFPVFLCVSPPASLCHSGRHSRFSSVRHQPSRFWRSLYQSPQSLCLNR